MKRKPHQPQRILAIDPTPRGFGFVILEWQWTLVDWGCRRTTGDKHTQSLAKLTRLIGQYDPHLLVIEDTNARDSRRCERVRTLLAEMVQLARGHGLEARRVSRKLVKQVFLTFGATTKHHIAQVIASQLPELAADAPPPRKPWMDEAYRMAMFDAAAFALTHFYSRPMRENVG